MIFYFFGGGRATFAIFAIIENQINPKINHFMSHLANFTRRAKKKPKTILAWDKCFGEDYQNIGLTEELANSGFNTKYCLHFGWINLVGCNIVG